MSLNATKNNYAGCRAFQFSLFVKILTVWESNLVRYGSLSVGFYEEICFMNGIAIHRGLRTHTVVVMNSKKDVLSIGK